MFILDQRRSFHVVESTHYTTLAAWGLSFLTSGLGTILGITTIKDNLWLFCGGSNLVVFISEETTDTQSCLSLWAFVVWCSFSPDGTRIATYTSDGFINLWNVDSCEVYDRFRNSTDISSGACWWSTEYLFVCHLQDGVPNLSKYPVDQSFNLQIDQNVPVSLLPIVSTFLPFSGILSFSEGYISFASKEISPTRVVNVNRMECPAMVSLPEITPTMSIVVSPGASFMLGQDVKEKGVIVWKRIDPDPLSYFVHMKFPWGIPFYSQWCFSKDLKLVFSYVPSTQHCFCVDLVNTVCQDVVIGGYIPYEYRVPAKVFFTKGILVIVTSSCIKIVDSKELRCIGCIYPRNLTAKSVVNSKLSPNGNILAVPTMTNDMDFFEIFHSGSF